MENLNTVEIYFAIINVAFKKIDYNTLHYQWNNSYWGLHSITFQAVLKLILRNFWSLMLFSDHGVVHIKCSLQRKCYFTFFLLYSGWWAERPYRGDWAAVATGVQKGQRRGEQRQREGRGHQGAGSCAMWVHDCFAAVSAPISSLLPIWLGLAQMHLHFGPFPKCCLNFKSTLPDGIIFSDCLIKDNL